MLEKKKKKTSPNSLKKENDTVDKYSMDSLVDGFWHIEVHFWRFWDPKCEIQMLGPQCKSNGDLKDYVLESLTQAATRKLTWA